MRGDGCVFQKPGTRFWWIAYSFRGRSYQESSGSEDQRIARRLLRQRLREVTKPKFVNPAKEQRWTLDDMLEQIRLDYERKKNRTFDDVRTAFTKHLKPAFEFDRVIDITADRIAAYSDKRVNEEKAADASVNRELAALRRGFKLMVEKDMLSSMPVIKLRTEDNVRRGFLALAEFGVLKAKITDPDVKDIVEFLYHTGMRSNEAKQLRWSWLNAAADMVTIPAEYTKNKEPRSLPIVGALLDVIERRQFKRHRDCDFIFHRKGKPIRSFRRAFKAAAREMGLPGLLPHDMRRSAVRNFRRAGLSEQEGMALSGHLTDSVYRRYSIISDGDRREVMQKVQDHLQKEDAENRKKEAAKQAKVVRINRKRA